jgi:uncharacterized protein (DUF58 family)
VLFGGSVGLAGWLLGRQTQFTRVATRTADNLTVRVRPTRESVVADESLRVTLTATLESPAEAPVTVAVEPPVGTTGWTEDDPTLTVPVGETEATTAFSVTCPVAGRHVFDRPLVTTEDSTGLFRSQLALGNTASVVVDPKTPDDIHVGEAGTAVAGAFGQHGTGDSGPGLTPADLREYVPGDPADSIDWKTTARLGRPHVTEYDVEVDLQVAIVVDHRSTMDDGPEGRTKLDYARQVALSYSAAAARDSEAVGLYAVGDGALTVRLPPDVGSDHYESIRRHLHELQPSTAARLGRDRYLTPGETRRTARRLAADDSKFSRGLLPFVENRDQHVADVDDDPLYGTVRSQVRQLAGTSVTVLVIDDSHPAEVREAVRLAREGDDYVVAFLLPSVLYEPGGLADLEAAHERYLEFEQFRRSLDGLPRVSAFEVAPEDRIQSLLGAQRRGTSA